MPELSSHRIAGNSSKAGIVCRGIFSVWFCCALCFASQAHAKTSRVDLVPALQIEIVRLQSLSETNPAAALQQLEALQAQLPTSAVNESRKELLLALIPLYIDAGDKVQAKRAIASLAIQDELSKAMATVFRATILLDNGQLSEALELIEQTLSSIKKLNDAKLNYQADSLAGDLYSKVGNFKTALTHQLAALDALGENKDRQSELSRAKALDNIGRMYLRLKNPPMAMEYNAKAHEIAERIGADNLLATIATNLGYAYADQQKFDQAIVAYNKGLQLALKVGDVRDEIRALNNMADAEMNQNHFIDCANYASQAITVAKKNGKEESAAIALGNLGVCHIRMGMSAQGSKEIKQSTDFLRDNKASPILELMLGDASFAYKKVGRYQDALNAKDEQYELATDLFHTQRDRAVMELQVRFEVNQRQKEIEALEQKNRLQNSEIHNKNLQRIIAILTIIVAIAVATTMFYFYRRVRRSNHRLRSSNRQLEHKSNHDALTGLLNRRAFEEQMKNIALFSQANLGQHAPLPSVLCLLDIDHFKYINDTYGHQVGDLVLVELGRRLQSVLREKDMLIRWGGEEFMIYLHAIPAERIAHAIDRALIVIGATPFIHEGKEIKITISIGFIQMPLHDEIGVLGADLNWDKELQLCDEAMYMAKNAGRNQAVGIQIIQGGQEPFDSWNNVDLHRAIKMGIIATKTIDGPVKATSELHRLGFPV